MKISDNGLQFIASFEGLMLDAYPDPATKNDPVKKGEPWTIGYGTTIYPSGQKVKKGDKITKTQALEYLKYDVSKFASQVDKLVVPELNQNQQDALISFAYNVGIGNLKSSTLLKKVNANASCKEVQAEFKKWNKANGKVLNGLVRRRDEEAKLFCK